MFEPIVEPVVFILKTNQHSGSLSMPRDYNLLGRCQAEESR